MNYTTGMEEFCGGVFFDPVEFSNKNDTVPHLPECFMHTVLVWIPVITLFAMMPYQCWLFWKIKHLPLPWRPLLITKLLTGTSSVIVTAILFMYSALIRTEEDTSVGRAEVVGFFLLFLSMVLLQSCVIACRFQGHVSSIVISLSYLLFTIFGIPEFAVRIDTMVKGELDSHYPQVLSIIYVIYYVLMVLLLILAWFADKHGDYEGIGKERKCPENESSYFSRGLYAWLDGLCITGWKRPLTYDDLWQLDDSDTSETLVKTWESYWSKREEEYHRQNESYLTSKYKHPSKKEAEIANFGKSPKSTSLFSLNGRRSTYSVKAASAASDSSKPPPYPSVVFCLFLCLKGVLIPANCVKMAADIFQFLNPVILNWLLQFLASHDEPLWKGYVYAGLMFMGGFGFSILLNWYFHCAMRIGMNIKTILTAALFKKALKLDNSARRRYTTGDILNLMSVDIQRFMDLMIYVNYTWSTPITIALSMYFLYAQIGIAAFAGLAVMVLLIPVNFWFSVEQRKLQFAQMSLKDTRLKMINEILNGIKVLKLYAWEQSFEKQVTEIRARELAVLKKSAYYSAVAAFTWASAPVIVAVVSFACYVLLDPSTNVLTPQRAFVSLSLFNILRGPLTMMSMVVQVMVQVLVSNKRIQEFLLSKDLDPNTVERNGEQKESILVDNATFTWDRASGRPDLTNINMRIMPGQLVAVVGQVGAGKSSLINAILGEMHRLEGYAGTKGSIAYVPQQAWIQNLTLRQNITFSKSYGKLKYDRVIEACALKTDLEILPGGDSTEIGEKGMNVSGGQKQRISLARAVYEDADVYLMDDPLSAVDAHVGKHIFQNVVSNEGMLNGKTRILVTHGLGYLKHVDKIIVLRDGRISEVGTYQELMRQGGAFADLIDHYLEEKVKEAHDDMSVLEEVLGDDADQATLERLGSVLTRQTSGSIRSLSDMETTQNLLHLISQLSGSDISDKTASPDLNRSLAKRGGSQYKKSTTDSLDRREVAKRKVTMDTGDQEKPEGTKLVQEEQTETGTVKYKVYLNYLAAIGWMTVAGILTLYAISNAFFVGSSVWLTAWSNDGYLNDTESPELRIAVFAILGVSQSLFTLLGALLMAYGAVLAGSLLHQRLFRNLLHSPMSFYDVTPMGRIINRIGKDIDVLDNLLPLNLRNLLQYFTTLVCTLIVIMIGLPTFGIVIAPLGIVYWFVQRVYIGATRQLKRLEATSRSPIYSHFQETVSGSVVIRAYQVQPRFINESQRRVDFNNRSYFPSIVNGRWLGVRLDTIATICVVATAIFAVITKTLDPDENNAGTSGVAVSYAMGITAALYFTISMTCEVETNIVSVERVKEYSETPTEAEWRTDIRPTEGWPEKGLVTFDHYKLRYRPGLELVLKGISCRVKGGERIGIVGRTGAGKSSLTLALFRMVEAADGKILIDGQDISKIGLHDLRSRLTIIPQDPVLFSGTLRMNLDPFGAYTDEQVWKMLEQSHLKDFVMQTPGKLTHAISEGGENLSVGQRQLVCLARALLRKTKVLILDEATAAVDLETDDLIQKTIRTHFADCTVLTIAHRLNTILDSDRVLVLSKGEIVELDKPNNLLENSHSTFYSMAKEAGLI